MKRTGVLLISTALIAGLIPAMSASAQDDVNPSPPPARVEITSPADGGTLATGDPFEVDGTVTVLDEVVESVNSVQVFVLEADLFLAEDVAGTDDPAVFVFDAEITAELNPGPYTICASAVLNDGSIRPPEDCVAVTVVERGTVGIDCSEFDEVDCIAEDVVADDGSTLDFSAPPDFNEVVTIIPNAGGPGECGGFDCRTGFDVLFDKPEIDGLVGTIVVTTAERVPFRQFLRAAVFIDGERITAECSVGWIKRIRDRLGIAEPIPCKSIRYVAGGRVQYLVRFDLDPQFRFR